ncbi:hypothetical protein Tco_1260445, partial [Tanacetum coccineum]
AEDDAAGSVTSDTTGDVTDRNIHACPFGCEHLYEELKKGI